MSDIDDQRVARRGAATGEPAGASPQGVAPGKRVATRRLAPARESRPVEHTTTHDTHGGIAPSDPTAAAATDDPFGMHLLAESSPAASGPGGDGLALDEGAAPAALPIVTPGSSSSGRRLAFEPSRLQMPATRIGQTSPTRAATLTNHSRRPVEIVDLIPMGRAPTVTSPAIDTTQLAPGAATQVHVEFRPTREGAHREALVVETDHGPDVALRVGGRGLPSLLDATLARDPAAQDERDAEDRAAHTGSARRAAHAGHAPSLHTYDELDAAFTSAVELGEARQYEPALVLATAVAARMRELAHPQHTGDVLDRLGVGRHAALRSLGLAVDAAVHLRRQADGRWPIVAAPARAAFQQARGVIVLMTGDSDDASDLRAFDHASLATAAVAAAPIVAGAGAAASPLAVKVASLLGSEVGLIAHAGRGVFYTVSTWIATHPEEALAWAELFTAWAIQLGEDPAGVAEDLTTLDGWHRVARDILFSIVPVRTGRQRPGPDGPDDAPAAPASRAGGPRADTVDDPPPARQPTGPGDVAGDEPATARPADSPAARQLADQTLDRLRGFVAAASARKGALLAGPASGAPTAAAPTGPAPAGTTDRPRVLESFVGSSLASPRDLQRRHPDAQVIAAEARFPPSADDIARFRAEGGEFLAERFAESIPPGSVEKIYVRYPIPHKKGEENLRLDLARAFEAEFERNQTVPPIDSLDRMRRSMEGDIESITNLGPHAVEKLTMGGTMEVTYWEKEILSEVRTLTGRPYMDPASGELFAIEISSPPRSIPRDALPDSGAGIPDYVRTVSQMTIRKVPAP